MWNRDRLIALAVGVITVILTLLLLALFETQGKVQVDCMDPTEREKVRDLVLSGIDKGFEQAITHLFDIWTKDLNEQPRRAMVGTNNAVNAHIRARKQALAWSPPTCEPSKT
jgi:hypothetical protein